MFRFVSPVIVIFDVFIMLFSSVSVSLSSASWSIFDSIRLSVRSSPRFVDALCVFSLVQSGFSMGFQYSSWVANSLSTMIVVFWEIVSSMSRCLVLIDSHPGMSSVSYLDSFSFVVVSLNMSGCPSSITSYGIWLNSRALVHPFTSL